MPSYKLIPGQKREVDKRRYASFPRSIDEPELYTTPTGLNRLTMSEVIAVPLKQAAELTKGEVTHTDDDSRTKSWLFNLYE
jgi:hypothetical protein